MRLLLWRIEVAKTNLLSEMFHSELMSEYSKGQNEEKPWNRKLSKLPHWSFVAYVNRLVRDTRLFSRRMG